MGYKDPEKQKQYQARWWKNRHALRKRWFAEHGPCVDCGTWERLEVDHKESGTKIGHSVWTWSKDRRNAELAKCVPRCRSCHQLKTIRCQENPAQVLTEHDVRQIRKLKADTGYSIPTIAKMLGLERHRKAVQYVLSGKCWGHVK